MTIAGGTRTMSAHAPEVPVPTERADPARLSLTHRVAASAVTLLTQFGATTVVSAVATIAITRLLGPSGYGVYGTALATAAVLGSTADLGFTTMLSRDMAHDQSATYRPMLRSAYQVAGAWSMVLALVMVALAFAASISSPRGLALLVLAPSMAFNGLNPASALFLVTYQTKRLMRINVLTILGQAVAATTVAAAHLGPVAVTATVSASSIINGIVIAVVAQRMLPPGQGRFGRRELLRRSAPLGALAILTRTYGMIDLVLLGWFVAGPRLGDYAAAAKLLAVMGGVAGTVMAGSLPGLATIARGGGDGTQLSARIWHWLMVSAIPAFVGLALLAPPIIELTIGPRYRGAVPLLRILAIFGVLSVLTNLAGNVLVAVQRMRPLYVQSVLAIVLNVGANLILIPRYGVYASAWITVATEALVCSISVVAVRRHISIPAVLRVSRGPAAALAVATALTLPFLGAPVAAAAVYLTSLLVMLFLLHSWPEEFHPLRARRA